MHPDLPTGNTQAIVMVAAEAAVSKILALKASSTAPVNPSAISSAVAAVSSYASHYAAGNSSTAATITSSTVPVETSSTAAFPLDTDDTPPSNGTVSSGSNSGGSGGSSTTSTAKKYDRCGGKGWTGPTQCETGCTCKVQNPYYSQCIVSV